MTFRDPSHSRNDFHLCLLLFSFFFFFLRFWLPFSCALDEFFPVWLLYFCLLLLLLLLPPSSAPLSLLSTTVRRSVGSAERNKRVSLGLLPQPPPLLCHYRLQWKLGRRRRQTQLINQLYNQQPAETHYILLIQKLILISYRIELMRRLALCQIESYQQSVQE